MLGGQAQDEDPIPPAPEDGHQLPLAFFGLGQPVPPAGLDLNFPPGPEGGMLPVQQDGEWDQWIVNEQPFQQDPQPPLPEGQHIQQDELQHSNQHSDLSSDSSSGVGQFVINGHALIGNGIEINDAPFDGQQEVVGPGPQVEQAHVDVPPQAHVDVPNNNHHQNLEMNFMVHQDWQPDPVFQMIEERGRAVQFSRLWAKFFAPAGSTDHSVGVPEKWAPFFLSNLLQPESFSWSRTFLLSDIPSKLQEQGMSTVPFVVPKDCPVQPSLGDVTSGVAKDTVGQDGTIPIIVESGLRRSKRLQESRNGFRHGACTKRNCLMCQHNFGGPPPLSSKVLRNLGTRLCDLSEDDLSEQKLKKKEIVCGTSWTAEG